MKPAIKIVTLSALSALALSVSGCATMIATSLKNKLPKVEAEELTVAVQIATVGGGSATVKDQKYDADGNLVVGEIDEVISTGASQVTIKGKKVKLYQKK